jgi:hypothetical protein
VIFDARLRRSESHKHINNMQKDEFTIMHSDVLGIAYDLPPQTHWCTCKLRSKFPNVSTDAVYTGPKPGAYIFKGSRGVLLFSEARVKM